MTHGEGFGDLLRHLRRARGLTQEDLAERSGVSSATISLLERGRTHAAQHFTVRALSAALALEGDDARAFADVARGTFSGPFTGDEESADATPPPATSRHGDLPVPLTPLIGREHEVESLLALLEDPLTRLLTLTGAAGAGKTRLALHVAAQLQVDARTEVIWIGLIPIQEPERVLTAIAMALGVRDEGVVPLRDALVDALRGRHCILLLDNFEQVLPAARVVLEVLMACEGVRALVTSRAALNVRGERCFPVAPLALPDAAQLASQYELPSVPSVALFVERVTACQPAFALDGPETGRLVADICVLLDGLPLAIELAAARIRHLGLRQLHERITQSALLSMLTEGPQDLAEHQRTMRSTIAWSYGLLGATERLVFRWLGIFVGGASLEALQAISDLSEEQIGAALVVLTDANLVRHLDDGTAPRYTQLVTLRAYAQEQLRELGEWEEARRRHAAYFADFVKVLVPSAGTRPETVLARVDADYENVRAALAWAYATNATAVGIRMVGALRRFWGAQSQFVEGLEWLERFLARAEAPTTNDEREALAEAWTGVLVLCHRQDRFERALEAGEKALALWREKGDLPLIAGSMMNLAIPLTQLRDFDRAAALLEESLALQRQTGNREGMVFPLMNLGCLYYDMCQPHRALEYYQQSLALSQELGETEWARGLTWCNVGEAYIALDDTERAVEVTGPVHRLFAHHHDHYCAATCAFTLGRALWRLAAYEQANQYLFEAERLYRAIDNRTMAARALGVRAGVALDSGHLDRAREHLARAYADLAAPFRPPDLPWWFLERAAACSCQSGEYETAASLFAEALRRWEIASAPIDPAERALRERTRASLPQRALDASTPARHSGSEPEPSKLITLVRRAVGADVLASEDRLRTWKS